MSIRDILKIPPNKKGDISVKCPLHEDSHASGSINFEEGVYNCFAKCGGMTIDDLEKRLKSKLEKPKDETNNRTRLLATDEEINERAEKFISKRLPEQVTSYLDGLSTNIDDKHRGFIWFQSGEDIVGRNLFDGDPKYYNKTKKLFWLKNQNENDKAVWLTEGILDAISLRECGVQNVAAALTANPPEERLYDLRGRTVFIIFDSDYAGFKGARETAEKIKGVEGNPIIVDFPRALGKDINEAWINNRRNLKEFISGVQSTYSTRDRKFIEGWKEGQNSLVTIPTGLNLYDLYLGGGFKTGEHILGAVPGAGKTNFAASLAKNAAEKGFKVLVNTCEIAKTQYWARIASIDSKYTWIELEKDPTKLEKVVFNKLQDLADNIRIVVGWKVEQLLYAGDNYDLIIVDYLQRVPTVKNFTGKKDKVSFICEELSSFAVKNNKVVLTISSLSRSGYDHGGLDVFKESGDIEYVVQSATVINVKDKQFGRLSFDIRKNTRGLEGEVDILTDFTHCLFDINDYEKKVENALSNDASDKKEEANTSDST